LLTVDFSVTGTVTDLYVAPSPSAVPEVLKSPSVHDLQVYGLIFTAVLCAIVFGGVKMVNRVSPAFLIPVILSIFFIFIGIFTAGRFDDTGTTTHLFLSPLSKHCCMADPLFRLHCFSVSLS
jgi:potassium/chloride transporter 4/5/6